MADTTHIYIDEASGSDTTGTGAEDKPYQTLAFAIFTHSANGSPVLRIRKDPNTPYDEPTQSAVKKAKKGAEGLEKKKKKADELKAREEKEGEEERLKREKVLEDSKKIVLEEDASLDKATRVRSGKCFAYLATINASILQVKLFQLPEYRQKRVRVFGWVHRLRSQKEIIFIVLRDGTGYLQAVLSGRMVR